MELLIGVIGEFVLFLIGFHIFRPQLETYTKREWLMLFGCLLASLLTVMLPIALIGPYGMAMYPIITIFGVWLTLKFWLGAIFVVSMTIATGFLAMFLNGGLQLMFGDYAWTRLFFIPVGLLLYWLFSRVFKKINVPRILESDVKHYFISGVLLLLALSYVQIFLITGLYNEGAPPYQFLSTPFFAIFILVFLIFNVCGIAFTKHEEKMFALEEASDEKKN